MISPLCFYYDCRPGARQHDVIYKSWYHSLLYFWSSAPELRSGYTASCSHVSQESDQHNPFVEDWHALVVRQCARILMLIMHSSSPQPAKSVTCAPALVCPMALARPLAQLCNNKSLQPVLNPFCRHEWAGLGLTHLANRKRCWLVPLLFCKGSKQNSWYWVALIYAVFKI